MAAFHKHLFLPLLLLLVFFLSLPRTSFALGHDDNDDQTRSSDCSPISYECGDVRLNISYPFRENEHQDHCSHPGKEFEIACNKTDNSSQLELLGHKYHVRAIDYENQTLTVVSKDYFNVNIFTQDSCCRPTFEDTPLDFGFFSGYVEEDLYLSFLYDCRPLPVDNYSDFKFLECLSNSSTHAYYTLLQPNQFPEKFRGADCKVKKFPILEKHRRLLEKVLAVGRPSEYLWNWVLINGFKITWSKRIDPENRCWNCFQSSGHCGLDVSSPQQQQQPICYCGGRPCPPPSPSPPRSPGAYNSSKKNIKIIKGVSIGVASFLICILVFYYLLVRKLPSHNSMFFWNKKTHDTRKVEAFLESYGSLVPKRYQYSEIKRMTNSFNDNLGQGGYGSVFKGKLKGGHLVAVKILNKSKGGNGEEFINEVASIGRTNHVNVVSLLGFCSEGSKRALVYEFMPKGSLEKLIYSDKQRGNTHILDCQKLLQIALGIARGLVYLHRGCNTRILHLDIKPHNILLDDNFCPKISDFGLAKLCPGQESTISMLEARGTVGYIAPEVFCRNIGGVSHKSDVYSYGMMVLEMIGGRQNVDARVDNTSEIYFPHWAHKHINLEDSGRLFGFQTGEEEEIGKKMVLVGLWCIQTDPTNRPSMSNVVEMLEGSLGSLQMPPKPYLSSPSRSCSSII